MALFQEVERRVLSLLLTRVRTRGLNLLLKREMRRVFRGGIGLDPPGAGDEAWLGLVLKPEGAGGEARDSPRPETGGEA